MKEDPAALELVSNVVPFPTPPDVASVLDAFSGMVGRGEVAKCIVFYEKPDTTLGWLNSSFGCASDQFGFIEYVKLFMFKVATHED